MGKRENFLFLIVSVLVMCILLLQANACFSQALQRITHLTGTQQMRDISVTATASGLTAILTDKNYCGGETGPYYMGYNTYDYTCRNGSYTFQFNPPVSEVKMNFTGLSRSVDYNEELLVYVNGKHYPIPDSGLAMDCEPLANISANGNLTGCNDCSTSGWKDLKIKGPIYSLTVVDSVIFGEPAGALFALWIGYVSLEVDLGDKVHAYKKPNAAGESLIIEAEEVDLKLISIEHPTFGKTEFNGYSDFPYICLNITEFTKGEEYIFEFLVNDVPVKKKIIIW